MTIKDRIKKLQEMLYTAQEKCKNTWCDEKGKEFNECVLETLVKKCNGLLQLLDEIQ